MEQNRGVTYIGHNEENISNIIYGFPASDTKNKNWQRTILEKDHNIEGRLITVNTVGRIVENTGTSRIEKPFKQRIGVHKPGKYPLTFNEEKFDSEYHKNFMLEIDTNRTHENHYDPFHRMNNGVITPLKRYPLDTRILYALTTDKKSNPLDKKKMANLRDYLQRFDDPIQGMEACMSSMRDGQAIMVISPIYMVDKKEQEKQEQQELINYIFNNNNHTIDITKYIIN